MRIADKVVTPWQASNDDDRKGDQANRAVNEDGIGCRTPSDTAARDQPKSHGIAADRGWQRLVEERPDEIETHRLSQCQRCAALRADHPPSQDADKNLKKCHGNRDADPSQACKIEARRKIGKIDLAQGKVKERRGDQYFYCRKQYPAHFARATKFEKIKNC